MSEETQNTEPAEKEVKTISLEIELRNYQQSTTETVKYDSKETNEETALKKARNKFETRHVKIVSCKPV